MSGHPTNVDLCEDVKTMDLGLSGRPCLVTGASVGIGAGVARVMAAEGTRLAITARREEHLETLAEEIAARGAARPLVIVADLTTTDAPSMIRDAVLGAFGRLDILINNAGGSRPIAADAPDNEWDEAFDLNFTAARRLAQVFLSSMRAQGWGRIINMTGSSEPAATNAAIAAKSALHAWAKGLSCDVAADGITVNAISPGRIMSEQVTERLHPSEEDRRRFAAANIPLGYFGEPEDMAYLTAFLASPLARYITGEIVHVDGGMRRFAH
jgi:3-oxoacyl-[acyl-carrier protein] reductase